MARNSATKMTKRRRLEGELVALYDGEMRAKSTLGSVETWVGENACAWSSPKNDREYYHESAQTDSVSGDLKKPITKRTPGITVHIAACSANGGVSSKPHSAPSQTNDGVCGGGVVTTVTF